jgi:hypothetical protein
MVAMALFGALAPLAGAQTPEPALTPEELAAIGGPDARGWEITGSLRGAFGYKENLLLSAVRTEDSPFVQGEAEVFWWRLPTERFEALAFANASLTRFTDSDENPREWQAFAHAEGRWFAHPKFQATGAIEGYHLDQVFDLSASAAERLTARLGVTGALLSTTLRFAFRPDTWLEVKPTGQRDRYHDGSDDNTQRFARATLGRTFRDGRFEFAVAGQALARDYESRPQFSIAGRPLAGTSLTFAQREYEARFTAAWDEARRWHTTTSATHATNDDNGSGYFNYHFNAVRQELSWTRAPWSARLSGRLGNYDYDVQTQGIGIEPPPRWKEETAGTARLERELKRNAVTYVEFAWERSRSNDPLANYRVRTTSAGVDWRF